MAKKATNIATEETKVEEVVSTVETKVETVEVETKENVPVVIAKTETPLRKIPSLESKYIVGQMKVGVAYRIDDVMSSKIYGDFYLLENGYYITKSGNYVLN